MDYTTARHYNNVENGTQEIEQHKMTIEILAGKIRFIEKEIENHFLEIKKIEARTREAQAVFPMLARRETYRILHQEKMEKMERLRKRIEKMERELFQ